MTKRNWRARHRAEEGEELHHVVVSITTPVLDAMEQLADRERISRAHAGGKLVEMAVANEERRIKNK